MACSDRLLRELLLNLCVPLWQLLLQRLGIGQFTLVGLLLRVMLVALTTLFSTEEVSKKRRNGQNLNLLSKVSKVCQRLGSKFRQSSIKTRTVAEKTSETIQ